MSDTSDTIRLDQFLKLCDCASTGGEAKLLIQGGDVTVNGVLETRRRRKLVPGDVVVCRGEEVIVLSDSDEPPAA
jgi:ribosome-associated protein